MLFNNFTRNTLKALGRKYLWNLALNSTDFYFFSSEEKKITFCRTTKHI
uniref:Uncharacterized protein n=1 Tax=Anguilla anguilla TaxID=7936 RepID=A0A0E9RKN1_ANGAN